ncbi:hypothetical protein SRHO_G00295260 [Serrasalmus rhombeus]
MAAELQERISRHEDSPLRAEEGAASSPREPSPRQQRFPRGQDSSPPSSARFSRATRGSEFTQVLIQFGRSDSE